MQNASGVTIIVAKVVSNCLLSWINVRKPVAKQTGWVLFLKMYPARFSSKHSALEKWKLQYTVQKS